MFTHILQDGFNISADSVVEVQGGWSAAAYRVTAGSGQYFLKVFDKRRPTAAHWISRIDRYLPALVWLDAETELRGRVPRPLPARDGRYRLEDDSCIYLLFPYLSGEVPGERPLTVEQTVELSDMIAQLHRHGTEVPFPTDGLAEDISLPFCDRMAALLRDPAMEEDGIRRILAPARTLLEEAVGITKQLRDTARRDCGALVLCHTDAHNWNLIQGERLILLDWEGLCLAPPEADLFMFQGSPHFDAFMEAYTRVHRSFQIRGELLMFYQLRRRMEDIWEFVAQILYDQPDEDTIRSIHGHLRQEIAGTQRLVARYHGR